MTGQMRILQVITRADSIGGAQIHLLQLSTELVRQGHEVHVAAGPGTSYPEALRRAGCVFHPIPTLNNSLSPLRVLGSFSALRALIREIKPDLVCGHSSVAGILSKLAAADRKVPSVFTAHGWSFTGGGSALKRVLSAAVEKLFTGLNARIICVSEYDRRIALKLGVAAGRLVTIRNGIPFLPEPEARSSARGRTFTVAMVARFAKQKRQDILVRALAGIGDIQVRFVGDGPLEGDVKALAAKLGLGSKAVFLGWRDDIEGILAGVDAFCLVSDYEGLPLTILEAMRSGLPCVVNDVSGCGEAVVDGETGYLVPRGDVATLAARLKRLCEDPESALRMGRAGRGRFEECFTLQRMVDQTVALYRAVLAERRA